VEIPIALKVKVAYQASKGMHFLHSSGIVHRDLKSLNLLLDSKWNVKVRSPEHDTQPTQDTHTHTHTTHTHDAHNHTLVA
jgi:serine/threonine protein kinase